MAEYVIRSEEDIWNLIADLAGRPAPHSRSSDRVVVDGWSPPILYFPNEPVGSSVSRQSARALADYYERLERIFALIAHGEANRRKLTEDDREILDGLRIVVGDGSSFMKAVDKIIEAFINGMLGKMTDDQILLISLTIVVAYFGKAAFADWVKERAATRRVEIDGLNRLALSEQETRRAEIMASVVTRAPVMKRVQKEIEAGHEALVRSLTASDGAEAHGIPIKAEEARKLVSSERQPTDKRRLDGQFKVIEINNEPEDVYRVRFERVSDGWHFDAHAGGDEFLTDEDMDTLFWALRTEQEINVLVNAVYSGDGKITRAFVARANRKPE